MSWNCTESMRALLHQAPVDRRWRRRRLLLLLRRRPPLCEVGSDGVEWCQLDIELWRLVSKVVDLQEGLFRDVVMHL